MILSRIPLPFAQFRSSIISAQQDLAPKATYPEFERLFSVFIILSQRHWTSGLY